MSDAYAKIPVADLSLDEASDASSDGGVFWLASMPAVMMHYKLGRDEYWRLSVAEHRALFDYLVFTGVDVGVDEGED